MPALSYIEVASSSRTSHGRCPPERAKIARTRASASRTADSGTSAPLRFASASSPACRPARRPNVTVSISELPPRRLAPCTETHAHSPAAYRPGRIVWPSHVRVHAAHVVVGAGPDRDRLEDRIDARVVHRELARARQARVDLLGAEVGEVEQHAAVDAAPSSISFHSARETTSREASSIAFGAASAMKRSPFELRR